MKIKTYFSIFKLFKDFFQKKLLWGLLWGYEYQTPLVLKWNQICLMVELSALQLRYDPDCKPDFLILLIIENLSNVHLMCFQVGPFNSFQRNLLPVLAFH